MENNTPNLADVVWDDELAIKAEEFPAFVPSHRGEIIPLEKEEENQESMLAPPAPEKEYKFPTLRPRRTTTRMDTYQLKNLSKIVDSLEDPNDAAKAREVLNSGAKLSDIEKTIKIFGHRDKRAKWDRKKQDAAEKEKLKKENAFSVDRKKITQKYTQEAAAYKTMGTLLGRLTDNYQDDFVGWFDAPYNDIATVAPVPQEKGAGTYKQDFDALFIGEKTAKGMGANFTKSEQSMLRATMPNMSEKEPVYKRKLTNYIRTMRDILGNKLEAVRKGGYNVGELEESVKMLDDAYKNALNKFDFSDEDIFKEYGSAAPKKLRSIGSSAAPKANPKDLNPQKNLSREEKIKLLRGE